LQSALEELGELICEACLMKGSETYPTYVAQRVFEVHHRMPLATADGPVRTTLDDLAILCANCHKVVHASEDIDNNFTELVEHFSL
jgi:predicted HNH restriction endonuclease